MDNFLESVDLDKLLQTLDKTQRNADNHPFYTFLYQNRIELGDTPNSFYDLMKLYNKKNPRKRITEKTVESLCRRKFHENNFIYIKGIPYIKLNKKLKYKRKYDKKTQRRWDNFINKNNITIGSFKTNLNMFYLYYEKWCRKTRNRQPFSYDEFSKICRKQFDVRRNRLSINKDITIYVEKTKKA